MRPPWAGTAGTRTACVLLGTGCAVLLGAGRAQAHTSLASTVPYAGATVVEPVRAVPGGPVPVLVTGLVALGAALVLGAVRSGRRSRVGP